MHKHRPGILHTGLSPQARVHSSHTRNGPEGPFQFPHPSSPLRLGSLQRGTCTAPPPLHMHHPFLKSSVGLVPLEQCFVNSSEDTPYRQTSSPRDAARPSANAWFETHSAHRGSWHHPLKPKTEGRHIFRTHYRPGWEAASQD